MCDPRLRLAVGRVAVRAVVVLSAVVPLFASVPACSAAPVFTPGYLAELIQRAGELELARHPRWLALGHYEERGADLESPARGPHFFLADDGRTDPNAELVATLQSFADPDASVKDGEHPQCAFRARYLWLRSLLDFDETRLPAVDCDRFDDWIEALDPRGLTLVFPEAYMNNPASMFGHTLLRVDPGAGGHEKDLLAYAVNFAADVGGDGGVAFAFKGIFGFYDGTFSVLPYYEKLKQYGDWENRDVWEYRLALQDEETLFILAHVWELRGIPFQYFFFDDNCSYQLLALIEVVRPELRLRRQFPLWVIPVDTVRAVVERAGLVSDVSYRPSPATRIRYEGRSLETDETDMARRIALGDLAPGAVELAGLSDERRARVLSLAYAYLRFLYLGKDVGRDASAPRARAVLAALSENEGPAPVVEPPVPGVDPAYGHAVARFDFGGGVRDGEPYTELRLRPAFHALLDPVGGYTQGAEIEILEGAVRYEPESDRVRLEDLALIRITSIAPRDRLLRPLSWTTGLGLRTRLVEGSVDGELDAEGLWYGQAGAGLAWEPAARTVTYGLLRGVVEAGAALEHDVALGPQLEIGVLAQDPRAMWRKRLYASVFPVVVGDTTTSARVGLHQRFQLNERTALAVDLAAEYGYGELWLDARLSWQTYFRYPWDG